MSLKYLLYILFLESILTVTMIYSFKQLSKCELKLNIYKILLIILEIVLVSLNNIYNLIWFRIFCSFILSITLNKLLFNLKLKKTIFYTFIYSVVCLLCELLIALLLSGILKSIDFINNSLWAKGIFNMIDIIAIISLFSNKRIINFIKKIESTFCNNTEMYACILIITSFITFIEIISAKDLNNYYVLFISTVCFIFIILSITIILNEKRSNLMLMDKNKNILSTNQAYKKTIEECRELKHNFKHDLYSLKLVDEKELDKTIEELIKKYNKQFNWINDLEKIPEGIQGIIYLKQKEAEKNNVKIIANVKDIKGNYKNIINISNILGILIDNAVEATKNTSNNFVVVNFMEENDILQISILNNFNNEINCELIGTKNYSTKRRNSGIGLNYVNKIKDKNIKVNFTIENNVFISKIELANKK